MASGKVRVHELAKELGVSKTEILAVLRKQGEFVTSASSVVNTPVARRVREHYHGSVVPSVDAGPDVFGPTVANLVAELHVKQAGVVGYLRHLGVNVENGSTAVPPEFADQVRARFALPAGRRGEPARPDAPSVAVKAVAHPDPREPKKTILGTDPAYFYVQEPMSDVVHHLDYLSKRPDHALCGRGEMKPQPSVPVERKEICQACLARLPEYHEKWWRGQFETVSSELRKLQAIHRRLDAHSTEQKKHIEELLRRLKPQKKAQPQKRSSGQAGQASGRRSVGERYRKVSKREPRVPDSEVVRKRVQEMNAPRRPRTEAEKLSDEAARESMRSHKPSSWRIGRGLNRPEFDAHRFMGVQPRIGLCS